MSRCLLLAFAGGLLCASEAGDYAEVETSNDGGIASTTCTPENGRTEECHVPCA
jgi:hypothetical protein